MKAITPHVHMVCYSADPAKGFLTEQGIAEIKSGLAKEIFRQELTEIYQRQTRQRDGLREDVREALRQLVRQMAAGTLVNSRMELLMAELAQRLRHTSGKKQYGYLKTPLKTLVDEIVDELAKEPRVAAAYDLWYQLREDVLRTYKDDLPKRIPLSRQKEFKHIKNMVIQEAVRMDTSSAQSTVPSQPEQLHRPEHTAATPKQDTPSTKSPINSATTLLHQLANIFREQEPPLPSGGIRVAVDSKLLRKIKAKKIAQGHKADDHEPALTL